MRDHTGCKRQFIQLSRAWYGGSILPDGKKVDVITIGFYDHEGGTTGAFQVSWQDIGGGFTPRLCAFDDSWSALYHFTDLLRAMADIDGEDVSPDDFCKLLIKLGIEDVTRTESPYDKTKSKALNALRQSRRKN